MRRERRNLVNLRATKGLLKQEKISSSSNFNLRATIKRLVEMLLIIILEAFPRYYSFRLLS